MEVLMNKNNLYKFCIDIDDDLRYHMKEEEYEEYFSELIDIAIYNEYEIVKDCMQKCTE